MQQQGVRQTAQLAGSKTGRHEPAADDTPKSPNRRGKKKQKVIIAADDTPKSPNRRGKKKQKVIIHPTSVTTLQQIRALRVPAALDGYQSAAGSIFQRTASAQPVLPSAADCDPVPGFGRVFRQRE